MVHTLITTKTPILSDQEKFVQQANTLVELGDFESEQGYWSEAIGYYREALKIYKQCSDNRAVRRYLSEYAAGRIYWFFNCPC